jgi:hypothetical protein
VEAIRYQNKYQSVRTSVFFTTKKFLWGEGIRFENVVVNYMRCNNSSMSKNTKTVGSLLDF